MDCDTTGIEPDFALSEVQKTRWRRLIKIVNQSVSIALKNLGYSPPQVVKILRYLLEVLNFDGTPHVNREWLKIQRGLTTAEILKMEQGFLVHLKFTSIFTRFSLGEALLERLGVSPSEFENDHFNFLRWAGLSEAQIAEANDVICGMMTVEGAPDYATEHYSVFDCANPCGFKASALLRLWTCAYDGCYQPFLSGAISKTVNVPHSNQCLRKFRILLPGWNAGPESDCVDRDGL